MTASETERYRRQLMLRGFTTDHQRWRRIPRPLLRASAVWAARQRSTLQRPGSAG